MATQTGWQISELDKLPLSELISYYQFAEDWIKSKSGLENE